MEVARGSSPLYVTCRAPPFPPRIQRVCLWYIFSSKPQARIQLTSGQQPLLMPLKNNPEQKKTTSSWNTMCMTHRYVNIIKNQRKKHQETHIISIYIKSFISLTLLRPFHEKTPHQNCRFPFNSLQDQTYLNSLGHLVVRLSQHKTWFKHFPVFSTASSNRLWFYLGSGNFFSFPLYGAIPVW